MQSRLQRELCNGWESGVCMNYTADCWPRDRIHHTQIEVMQATGSDPAREDSEQSTSGIQLRSHKTTS